MPGRILAVDDDAVNLKLVSATLGREGYEVLTAGNGKDALLRAEEENPDLIILDVMMPDMNGYQVCSHLRENIKTTSIPIMMLTSLGSLDEKIKGFDAGADDYLSKPFAPDELLAHVKVLLRRSVSPSGGDANVQGKVIAVFSLRGGIGVSSVASNLAAGLTALWAEPAVLVDLALTSGQSALMFNLPFRRTWGNIADVKAEELDAMLVSEILLQHESGTRILASSPRPEQNEMLNGEKVTRVIKLLSQQFNYLVLDLPHDFSETTLAGLDSAHEILVMLAPEMAAVRSAVCALGVFESLNYPPEIIRLVLNWTFQKGGLSKKDIETAIHRAIDLVIPYADDSFLNGINIGKPPVVAAPQSPLGSMFEDLAFLLSKDTQKKQKPKTPNDVWLRVIHRFQQRQQKR